MQALRLPLFAFAALTTAVVMATVHVDGQTRANAGAAAAQGRAPLNGNPRTSDGQPYLQGTYDVATLTDL